LSCIVCRIIPPIWCIFTVAIFLWFGETTVTMRVRFVLVLEICVQQYPSNCCVFGMWNKKCLSTDIAAQDAVCFCLADLPQSYVHGIWFCPLFFILHFQSKCVQ
jgi:hypothetical protein